MSKQDQIFDLLVIGGGVLGFFHAYHAVNRGMRVLLLEKNAFPRGASTRNFGQVVPSGLDPRWQRYGRDSLEIYKTIQSQFDISLRQLGSIYIASDDDELKLIEELYAINQQNDYHSELWTARQCQKRYPQLKMEYCVGGLFFPEEYSANPRLMIRQLHRFLSLNPHYEVRFHSPVVDLRSESESAVTAQTSCGDIVHARKAIVCNGNDFQLLFPDLFQQSDLTVVKLQMMRLVSQSVDIPGNVLTGRTIRRYESFSGCPSWPEIKANEPDDVPWKKWGVHILFKQESDGSIILGDSHEYAPANSSDQLSFDISTDINEYMIDAARKIFDLPNWDVQSTWIGKYCQTDDPNGIYTHAVDDNIHIVTGIGGKGMTSSAGFANHSLEQILVGQTSGVQV